MSIKISYDYTLSQLEEDFLERISAEAKNEGVILEEFYTDPELFSGAPVPVSRPKKK